MSVVGVLATGCTDGADGPSTGSVEEQLASPALDVMNVRLAARGSPDRVGKAEYITAVSTGEFGTTVFAKSVGNRELFFHFAPGLVYAPGRLTYAVDRPDGAATGGLASAATEGAIDRAMSTWAHVGCAPLALSKNTAAGGSDLGIIEAILGFGGSFDYVGDVVQGGWQPGGFFDALAPDGGSFILGVTFTLVWTDAAGNLVDSNRDHRPDAAVREIYYNNNFAWTNQVVDYTSPLIDVESVALHEAGHGLSQAHFGQIFFDGYGTRTPGFQVEHLHFSPRAVMNAIYWDTQRSPLTTDVAGHCANWAGWH